MKFIIILITLLLPVFVSANITELSSFTESFSLIDHTTGEVDTSYHKRTILKKESTRILIKEEEVTKNGEVISVLEEYWEDMDNILNSTDIKNIIQHCAASGGVIEDVQIPPTNYQSCKMNHDNSNIWIGHVLFGIVKSESNYGDFTITTKVIRQELK